MERMSLDDFKDAVDYTLAKRRCIQAWLGWGNPLFLGFGTTVLPPIIQGPNGKDLKHQRQARYRLVSKLSSWRLDYGENTLGQSQDASEVANQAISKIVGCRVEEWQLFDKTWGLEIRFEEDLRLEIQHYATIRSVDDELWAVRTPDGFYSILTRSGLAYLRHKDEPLVNLDPR